MREFPKTLPMRTPCCARLATPAQLYLVAETVVRRTCPRCHGKWAVKITPIAAASSQDKAIHALEWTCYGDGEPTAGRRRAAGRQDRNNARR